MQDNATFKAALAAARIWSGGGEEKFESVGRRTLAAMIEHGLQPHHKVLDVGAGSLRVGWWLLHYIEPSNYHAIEPVHSRIDGAAKVLGVATKIHIYYNDDFEYPNEKFDFVIARSIWTHASKNMIAKMLSEFAENSAPGAKLLTSVLLARSASDDYMGDRWVGKVEQTDVPGTIRHSLAWIEAECRKNGLTVEEAGTLHGQTWLLVEIDRTARRG
jgi:cyclopropane fatty-acyl-phospholipid synthase-like methyltransferase